VRTFLLLLPAGLSALALGAHFLRRGDLVPVAACLAVFALLFLRRCWAARVVQVALLAGTIEWLRTLAVLLPARRAAGEPWVRLVVILGAVAAATLAGALLFETRRLRERCAGPGARAAGPGPGSRAPGSPA
jgi:hypothetical protein